MLAYQVPLERYPDTYNGQPLLYAALASQKNHMAVYLMGIYGSDTLREKFESAYRATGKRMDIGKSCVRFRRLDDLPLDVVGDAIAAVSLDDLLAMHDHAASLRKTKKSRAPPGLGATAAARATQDGLAANASPTTPWPLPGPLDVADRAADAGVPPSPLRRLWRWPAGHPVRTLA